MGLGLGSSTALPHCPWPRRQPVLWPTLAALALLSSVTEATLDPMARQDPAPVPAPPPPMGHLPGPRTAGLGSESTRPPPPPSPKPPQTPGPTAGSAITAFRRGRAARTGTRSDRSRPPEARTCRLRSQLVPVRALGLGHSSEELVRFRFCSGSCRRARSPHDLSLASLLDAGALRPPPGPRPISQPCCRPTHYEAVSFMDANSTWKTVERLSATACGCLG